MLSRRLRPVTTWLLVPLAWAATACSSSAARKPAADPPVFPAYTEADARLFDDRIDPNSVGLADVAATPRTDPIFRARTQSAETVARVRVATVTVDMAAGKPIYHLNLAVSDALARRGMRDDLIEISVRSESPGFGIVKWLDTRLIGRAFIGFFHRYGAGDDVQVHFHLSADNPEVVAAVRDATALGEVSGK